MRSIAIAALALAACSNVLGIDHFSTASDAAVADAPQSDAPAVDAMLDASVADAAIDAKPGAPDANVDARPVDARPVDARPPDAGLPDARLPDARLPDAKPAICGDGVLDVGEACDDGNFNNGDGCTVSCQIESGYTCTGQPSVCTPLCGDGVVVGSEACDDYNASACGTCSSNCASVQPPVAATGTITVPNGSAFIDGQTMTIDDGFNPPTVFEVDPLQNGVQPGHAQIKFSAGASSGIVSSTFEMAITNAGASLFITPHHLGNQVMLTHQRASSLGNHAITSTITAGGFTVTGMNGGDAGDCAASVGCASASDCASGVCDPTQHKCI